VRTVLITLSLVLLLGLALALAWPTPASVSSLHRNQVVDAELAAAAASPPTPAERVAADVAPRESAPFDPERDLHGTVSDGDGRPIAAAVVGVERVLGDGYCVPGRSAMGVSRAAEPVRTGADGSYRIRLAGRGPFRVTASAAGFAAARRDGCLAGACVDFALGRGASLVGTVRALRSGDLVPAVHVRVEQDQALDGLRVVGETDTDAGGGYALADLPAGKVKVEVQPVALAWPRALELELAAGEVRTLDIQLVDGVVVRGRVLDAETRAPLAAAEVIEGWRGRSVRTALDGSFRIDGCNPEAHGELQVRAAGYADAAVPLRASMAAEIEVLLRRGRSAHGVVQDADGRPLAGAFAAAVASYYPDSGQRLDWRVTVSGERGEFAFRDLRADMTHSVFLRCPGFATAVYEFPADEGQRDDIDLGVFRLQPPASLAGDLRDEHGEPIADYQVKLLGSNADRYRGRPVPTDEFRAVDWYVGERQARTDDRGRFVFDELAGGDYALLVAKVDSHEQLKLERAVRAGEQVTGVHLELLRGMSIAGTVTVADGGDLPKTYASIDPEDGQATNVDVEIGADGALRARGLLPGNYQVTLYPYASEADRGRGRSFASVTFEHVPAGASGLQLALPVRRAIRGSVVDAAGAAVAGAAVAVFDGPALLDEATADAAGAFTLAGPPGRTLRVCATPPPADGHGFEAQHIGATVDVAPGDAPVRLQLRQ
jgi:protocatechuate 3,4-dioxygenase beta subunit